MLTFFIFLPIVSPYHFFLIIGPILFMAYFFYYKIHYITTWQYFILESGTHLYTLCGPYCCRKEQKNMILLYVAGN